LHARTRAIQSITRLFLLSFFQVNVMKKLLPVLLLASVIAAFGQARDLTRHVNPFIGTGGHGHTFPGATVPFGMVQLSPDTRIDNWDGSSGYHYSDNIIYGFSHTHLSGTGIPDGCDILFMPSVGGLFAKRSGKGYASKFSHANERSEPGYYSVKLDDDGIFAELTATKRVGMHRYTFPETGQANLILDLKWRDRPLETSISLDASNRTIEGMRRSSSWAKNQTVYFVAKFSEPVVKAHLGNGADFMGSPGSISGNGGLLLIELQRGLQKPLLLKVAISYVSIEGARKNLEAELPHWDFDKVRIDAKAAWNKELSKIEVTDTSDEQRTNFYTALYHTMIHPNVFNDVDGRYLGHDRKIHQLPNYLDRGDAETQRRKDAHTKDLKNSASLRLGGEKSGHYTVFSLWDTFRAAHPLYTIIDQKRTVDFINSFIRIYEQGGRLPVWELWGEETDTMIGYHAVSVIADAMAKGIEGFDYEQAYRAAKHSAELDHHGLAGYKRRGYISGEDDNESVSKTLEYAYNDWCIAKMAGILLRRNAGTPARMAIYRQDVETFERRARHFENLFDPKTGFFRPKKNAGFIEPFAPNEVTFHFTEGNSWQYSFFVPHDITRLMELMGGREKFAAKLDELFSTEQKLTGRFQPDITGLIGQYAHGNEPSHHIPYLYNYAGQPWKTQEYVRRIMDEFYKNAPDGLIGNEDCGQMSAWYVLSAAGFYPVTPGSTTYVIGTPLFPEVKFNLENGRSFIVKAANVGPKNIYIKSARLNGRPLARSYITHDELMKGGTVEFDMSNTPSRDAFSTPPVSSMLLKTVAVPIIEGDRSFRDQTTISIRSIDPEAEILYSIGGGKMQVYRSPFTIKETTTVTAMASAKTDVGFAGEERFGGSRTVEAKFLKRLNNWTVKLTYPYSTQYTGGGDDGIIDGIRGTANFASGEWQGYQGKPFEAVIDLGKKTIVKEVGGSFLQNVGSWIWLPHTISFEVSDDGVNFQKVVERKTQHPVDDMKPRIQEYSLGITPVYRRYVRVRAENFGKIPAWHPGAGGDPWIFVDEIFIRGDPFGNKN
jgi:putative alpha-1,2-mannosidase